jgi:single-strand DNA-binding protein
MNNITIAGQLGRDAEQRFLPNGDSVCSFSVADSLGKDKPTIWWACSIFGKRAEALGQYLTKGQAVTVSGSVSQREYTDKDGNKRTSMDVRVNDIAFQGGKREQQAAPEPQRKAPASSSGGFADMDSDVPFSDPMKNRAFALSI